MREITGQELKNVNQISEEAIPTDPVAGLLLSQINFYFHLVFFIGCCIVKRTTDLSCFQRLNNVWVDLPGEFEGEYPPNFLNTLIDEIQWMHLACLLLLVGS